MDASKSPLAQFNGARETISSDRETVHAGGDDERFMQGGLWPPDVSKPSRARQEAA
jgi:hypothetical protein